MADLENSLIVSGTGDVIEPDDGIIGIGSGGGFALSAARALIKHSDLSARHCGGGDAHRLRDLYLHERANHRRGVVATLTTLKMVLSRWAGEHRAGIE